MEWLGLKKKDALHRLVAGKYLKELLDLHAGKGTLAKSRADLTDLCAGCRNPERCRECKTEQELTCLCLESVF